MSVESGSSETANGGGRVVAGDVVDAAARFAAALDRLEQAVEAKLEQQAALADTEAEVQRMGADRTRLAEALDGAEARARLLEQTNREVSNRLVNAMEAIRQVLDGPQEGVG